MPSPSIFRTAGPVSGQRQCRPRPSYFPAWPRGPWNDGDTARASQTLHNPTPWQHGKAHRNGRRCLAFGHPLLRIAFATAPHDLQGDPGLLADLFDTSPSKPAITPDVSESRCPPLGFSNRGGSTIPLLDGRRLDLHGDREPQRVYDRKTLPPFDFLARIEPTEPPFSVVLTDCLSMTPALGKGSRPLRSRQSA